MIVKDEQLNHIATDINYDGMKWGALCHIIDEDGVTSELRWARGAKVVDTESL